MTVPTKSETPRILVVDDEEAILETMTFTFMDDFEVLTSTDARRALEILEQKAPIAVVITDQRMPNMTGVELLAEVYERYPQTVRIMLTGFADADATIQAINDGHIYAYINKPWEPDQLKQIVTRAVEHNRLAMENVRLVDDLRRTNFFLEAVMDRLDSGGVIAFDATGTIRAVNKAALDYLRLEEDPRGQNVREVLAARGLADLGAKIGNMADESGGSFEDVDLRIDGSGLRLRVSARTLQDQGQVVLFKEVSHEPLRRRFEEIVSDVSQTESGLRSKIEEALADIAALKDDVRSTGINTSGMSELTEKASRIQTAMESWLAVDDTLCREDYPDAQILLDRMRVANSRWPDEDSLPAPVRELARRVDTYYESGENSRQGVL